MQWQHTAESQGACRLGKPAAASGALDWQYAAACLAAGWATLGNGVSAGGWSRGSPCPARATIPASQEEGRCFAETTRLHAQLRCREPLSSGGGPESQVPEAAGGPCEQAFLRMRAG